MTALRSWSVILAAGTCFLVTGSAGLIYEIVWSRMLSLTMGNTSYALATLLTVFMGGLALGAWIAGRRTPATRWALRAYGLLELGIGLYCWVLPHLLDAAEPLFAEVYRRGYGSQIRFSLLQFLIIGPLLLLPTTMMGATLPILVRALARRVGVLGRTLGLLYAVNSFGAFAGAVLTGLVLLPALGMRSTHAIAVLLNVIAGVTATLLSFLVAPDPAPERQVTGATGGDVPAPDFEPHAVGLPRGLLLAGFGLCGFSAMVYQVAWTRAVTMAIGSSTYAFTLIAGAFLLGLSLGALLLGWIGDGPAGRKAVALIPLLIGLFALSTVGALGELPVRVARWTVRASSFAEFEWQKFKSVFSMFVAPTIGMGGLLPVVSRLMTRNRAEAARSVGDAYAANAIGTIVGSFCGGFVLIPWVGMRASILLASGLYWIVGLVFLSRALALSRFRRLMLVTGGAALGALGLAAAPTWEQSVVTSGPFTHAYAVDGRESDALIRERMHKEILYFDEGVAALVAVASDPRGNRELIVAGKRDASSVPGIQNWLGHLPMLVRPEAQDVLIIGLGSGHTLGSVAAHPGVLAIDTVEISGEVVHAARKYFAEFTGDPLADPRVRIIVGDGRLHLEYTDRVYDVIISQPSNPWIAGAAPLFTRESFAAMHRRLQPDGLACIWAQGFAMPPDVFQVLARTWAEGWAHSSVWVWQTGHSYLFLGSNDPLSLDFATLAARFRDPRVGGMLRALKIPSPAHLLGDLVTDGPGLLDVSRGAALNTDDGSRIEFDTPRGLFRDHAREILDVLERRRVDPWRFVATRGFEDEYLRANRQWLSQVLVDQREVERARSAPPEERRRILESILRRNPLHWAALRVLSPAPGEETSVGR